MLRRWLSLLLSAVAGATLGCGGTGNISGKVLLQGSPVTSGNVFLYQQGSNSVTAPIGADGSYHAENVPTGTVKVAIVPAPGGAKVDAKASGMMKGMQKTVAKDQSAVGEGPAATAVKFSIPEQYQDPEKSGITLSISRGNASGVDINLK